MTQVETGNEIDLVVTEDPVVQRDQVLRMHSEYVRRHGLEGRVVMIGRKLAKLIARAQGRERWEAGLTVLALDYVLLGCCGQIYGEALRLQIQSEGEANVNKAQSGGGSGGEERERG